MKKNIALTVVLALVLGVLVLMLVRRRAAQTAAASHRIGYTIVWQTTGYDLEGKFRPIELETRYVSAQGNFRSVKHSLVNGMEKVWFGEVGRGEFFVKPKEKQLDYVSPLGRPIWRTMETLKASSKFNRIEQVAGYEAAVMRLHVDGEPEDTYSDVYYAPGLNGELIEIVGMDEGKPASITEPIAIVKGEPDPNNLKHDEYPVDTTHYQEMHGATEDDVR